MAQFLCWRTPAIKSRIYYRELKELAGSVGFGLAQIQILVLSENTVASILQLFSVSTAKICMRESVYNMICTVVDFLAILQFSAEKNNI